MTKIALNKPQKKSITFNMFSMLFSIVPVMALLHDDVCNKGKGAPECDYRLAGD